MDFSLLLSSYATVWSNPEVLLMTFIGALGGILLGAIPGMTATMGVALLIPFSFGMDLIPSIGLLLGIYCGGMYGGSISAILIHAPGTPAAAATLLDGYPMCKKGQAGKALSVAMFASFCGGVIGALVMTFLSPLVADMAMNFGPGGCSCWPSSACRSSSQFPASLWPRASSAPSSVCCSAPSASTPPTASPLHHHQADRPAGWLPVHPHSDRSVRCL